MTVSSTLLGVFLKGVAASRPAANAVAGGTVYSATDTGVISQSDGSSWSTWATISSGLADPMTTRGDIMVRNASNVTSRLATGAAGTFFVGGTDPSYYAPVYTAYTPALGVASGTPPTLGSGSSALGRYIQFGKHVTVHGNITFGTSGTAQGTGVYTVSLPVTQRTPVAGDDNVIGYGWVYDSSAGAFRGVVFFYQTDTSATFLVVDGSQFGANSSPWAWAASDQIVFHLDYEAA